jgi:hypothetical protein
MNSITIREMNPSETPLLVKWLLEHKETNQVNFEPFRKNQCQIYVAEDKTGILCFIPIMHIYKFDALAPKPDLAAFRLAKVCEAMTNFMKSKAAKENVNSIWVQPSDVHFSEFLRSLGYGIVDKETLCMVFNMKSESTNG